MATTTPTSALFDQLVGRNIKQLRGSARLTQAEVAAYLTAHGMPCSHQIMHRIERGDRTLTFGEAVALADLFGVPVAALADSGQVQTVTSSRSTTWNVEDSLINEIRRLREDVARLERQQQPSLI